MMYEPIDSVLGMSWITMQTLQIGHLGNMMVQSSTGRGLHSIIALVYQSADMCIITLRRSDDIEVYNNELLANSHLTMYGVSTQIYVYTTSSH